MNKFMYIYIHTRAIATRKSDVFTHLFQGQLRGQEDGRQM